ncbi:MAG: hypothetical protein KGZ30_00665 [Anaplasmataceae bacterium]|nr:hypothetical protein [Anaplasmataceae bacterium]
MNIEEFPEFDNHRSIHFLQDKSTGLRAFVAIHRGGINYPSFGATRYWEYKNEEEAIRDVLRLSRGMSYKSAMAGLIYGGAKAVIMAGLVKDKKAVLRAYAEKLNYLTGHFVTGTDVGMTKEDLLVMARVSDNFVGLKANPEKSTVDGVCEALKVCIQEVFNDIDLSKRSFSVQGLGKTGVGIIEKLYEQGATIFATDINKKKISEISRSFPKINICSPESIYSKNVDVFVPCALSHSINKKSIKRLRVKIIAGSANNQLENEDLGVQLMVKGILYAPDYIVNAGGLISVINEYESNRQEALEEKIKNIGVNIRKIITTSRRQKKPTNFIANRIAENIFNNAS